jgi:hypothetical protein
MRAHSVARIAGMLSIAALAFAPGARAAQTKLDYDGVPKGGDFRTTPYSENGITTTVNQGHYELYNDATGADGDQAFNLDEENPNGAGPPIPSRVTITAYPASTFDVLSLDVVNPADSVGEYTISPVPDPGPASGIPAPTAAGLLDLSGNPAFQGIVAIEITQNTPQPCGPTMTTCSHAFTFDDVTVNVLPEPGAAASGFAAGLALLALSRRRAR